jgi:hypothetical protein
MDKNRIETSPLYDLLDAVEKTASIIKQYASEAEQQRRLSQPVVDAMAEAGLFRLWTPKAFGGHEVDPMTAFRVFEEVSRIDSAAGWNLQLSTAIQPFLAWLPDEGPKEIFDSGPDKIMGGAFFPQVMQCRLKVDIACRDVPFRAAATAMFLVLAPSFIMQKPPAVRRERAPLQMLVFFSSATSRYSTPGILSGCAAPAAMMSSQRYLRPQRRTAMLAPLENPGKPISRMTFGGLACCVGTPGADLLWLLTAGRLKKENTAFDNGAARTIAAQSQAAQAEVLLGAGRAYLHEALREGWRQLFGEHAQPGAKNEDSLATTHAARVAAKPWIWYAAAGSTQSAPSISFSSISAMSIRSRNTPIVPPAAISQQET